METTPTSTGSTNTPSKPADCPGKMKGCDSFVGLIVPLQLAVEGYKVGDCTKLAPGSLCIIAQAYAGITHK